jgi:integrase
VRFTEAALAQVQIPPGRDEIIVWDVAQPGFGYRIRRSPTAPGGATRRYVAQYETSIGATRRATLGGDAALYRVRQARTWAREKLAQAKLGADPQGAKTAERRAILVRSRMEQYLAEVVSRRRPATRDAYRRHLLTYCAALHAMPIEKVGRSHVAAVLRDVARNHGDVASNRARSTLSTFFTWLVIDYELAGNPVAVTRVLPETSRARVLDDTELAALWHATDKGHDYDRLIRLLMLTACRRQEWGRARWSEIDGDVFVLPAERSKNGTAHDVPLAPLALSQLPPRVGTRDTIFGRSETGFSGWSRCKALLDKRSGVTGWTPHDLRRSCATWLSENGVEPHITEAVLNHVAGSAKAGVRGIYNRATYAGPKRQALVRWALHIATITGQTIDNIVTLPQAR